LQNAFENFSWSSLLEVGYRKRERASLLNMSPARARDGSSPATAEEIASL
jgi:hypothetical protein